eukprot:scaffold4223_cov189-Amphora_coffeaeformis.AAC.38
MNISRTRQGIRAQRQTGSSVFVIVIFLQGEYSARFDVSQHNGCPLVNGYPRRPYTRLGGRITKANRQG